MCRGMITPKRGIACRRIGWSVVEIGGERGRELGDASVLVEYCPACAEAMFGSEGGGVREPTASQTKRGRVSARDTPNE